MSEQTDSLERRRGVLRSRGTKGPLLDEILTYNENVFARALPAQPPSLPLADEAFVPIWRDYAREAKTEGGFSALRRRLVQLNFPIRAGMSEDPEYRAATRRGICPPPDGAGLGLSGPTALDVEIHASAAGHIPVLIAEAREDFVALVQALTRRNEPSPVPPSLGSTMVSGYNNWDRIRRLRASWEESAGDLGGWPDEFERIRRDVTLYQDRFIVLSTGPYSGVAADELGLEASEWLALSLAIRRDHECTHYFTRRVFDSMRNNLLDELLADYMGLKAALGRFRADWFLRFMGLEGWPAVRDDGRVHTYRGNPPLSDASFTIILDLLVDAAHQLETLDSALEGLAPDYVLMTLALMSLEELASLDIAALFAQAYRRLFGESPGSLVVG